MRLGVLELNDQKLLIKTEDGQSYSEIGFAHLTDRGIETGEPARAKAWLQPQNNFNQHWSQLNQIPLVSKHRYARHHADIAFAQLKYLVESVDTPKKLIAAIPGCFSTQQLSLVLGLTRALNIQVIGIIDSALATCINQPQVQLLVELQLHQTLVTELAWEIESTHISAQHCIPNLGITDLYCTAAHHISELLIQQYRYDPLHSSEAEQEIYELIPNWLDQLTKQEKITTTLNSPKGELSLVINRTEIAKLFSNRCDSLKSLLSTHRGKEIYFAHSARIIPHLVPEFYQCPVLDGSLAVTNCFEIKSKFSKKHLHRITKIANSMHNNCKTAQVATQLPLTKATHLLYQNIAYPIDIPLSIYINGSQLNLLSKMDDKASVVISTQDGELKVLSRQPDLIVELPSTNKLGDNLNIAGHSLLLIGVEYG